MPGSLCSRMSTRVRSGRDRGGHRTEFRRVRQPRAAERALCPLPAAGHCPTTANENESKTAATTQLLASRPPLTPDVTSSPEAGTTSSEIHNPQQDRIALAVSLRKTQWLIDDAAHQIPEERYSPEQAAELADALEELACLVRATITKPVMIER